MPGPVFLEGADVALRTSEREGTQREVAWYGGEFHDMLWYGLLRREWEADR